MLPANCASSASESGATASSKRQRGQRPRLASGGSGPPQSGQVWVRVMAKVWAGLAAWRLPNWRLEPNLFAAAGVDHLASGQARVAAQVLAAMGTDTAKIFHAFWRHCAAAGS